jgi:hypothetical protein
MSDESNFSVASESGSVTITSSFFEEGEANSWTVEEVNDHRLMLVHADGKNGMAGNETGFAKCNIEVFKDLLLGLNKAQWSGCISCDTGYGVKRLFMRCGDIVFAGSNIIDDRLGEVIFRKATISLDELTLSAAAVTRKIKFGQVLINSGVFTNVALWEALQDQVSEIIRSVFMVSELYFELDSTKGDAPTEVIFADGTEEIIHESYSFGCTFRGFLGGLRSESEIKVVEGQIDVSSDHFKVGTFTGDLLQLIKEQPNVQELLNSSKLMDINTIACLAELIRSGYCAISPYVEVSSPIAPELTLLKSKIDAYGYVITGVKKAFETNGVEFPMDDMFKFSVGLNHTFRAVYLDASCNLSIDCINGMFGQCGANSERVKYFILRVESLIQFSLQIAGDNLDWDSAKKLRSEYRAISS